MTEMTMAMTNARDILVSLKTLACSAKGKSYWAMNEDERKIVDLYAKSTFRFLFEEWEDAYNKKWTFKEV